MFILVNFCNGGAAGVAGVGIIGYVLDPVLCFGIIGYVFDAFLVAGVGVCGLSCLNRNY